MTNGKEMYKSAESETYKKLLQEADSLLRAGKSAAAYGLLEPFEFEHSGKEEFDYLIGIAALDCGKPDKATLAFERVLMLNPNSAATRLEMARAYYQLGDMPRAKIEFENVLKIKPSAETQRIVQKYLDKIALQEKGKSTFISAYIEATLGHDSNANNANSQLQIFVDAIAANIVLDPASTKTADQYQAVAAGGEMTHEFNAKVGVFAGADLRQRSFTTQKNFDVLGFDARAGMQLNVNNDRLKLGVTGGQYTLGGTHYSDSSAVKAEWQHVFSPSNQLLVFVQKLKYTFSDVSMQPNDYIQYINGVGWQHVLSDGKANLFANCYFGNEQDISTLVTPSTPNGGRTDGAKNLQGVRLGGQTSLSDSTSLFVHAGLQSGGYNKTNPLFLRQRADQLTDMTLGTNWRWDKWWVLRTQLNYLKNESNIQIDAYDRTDISLTLRREFR